MQWFCVMTDSYFDLLRYILNKEVEGMNLRDQLLLLLFETFFVMAIGIFLHFRKGVSKKRILNIYLLVVYAGIILSFTVFRREIGSRYGVMHLRMNLGFDAMGIESAWNATMSMLNIILFIPWGIFIYLTIKNKTVLKKVSLTTFVGLASSLIIECIQLLTGTGMFEVTDLATNTLGSLVGALICCFFEALIRVLKQIREK